MMDLSAIAAPMVNQSDLPFRLLVRRYNTSLIYTQMLQPSLLLHDRDYLDFHLRGLEIERQLGLTDDVVVQLCGNDPQMVVDAGKRVHNLCTSIGASFNPLASNCIDLNLGCPQEAAKEGHYGAYLCGPGRKDWSLVQDIVSAMSHNLTVPISTKIRLCQPIEQTVDFAERLQNAGSSYITLHARTVSAKNRRKGAADLEQVKILKDRLHVPVVSNGNVRVFDDLQKNRSMTGADGLMVGETLLGNPCIFAGPELPDPAKISKEYLQICKEYPETVTLLTAQTHVRHFVEFQHGRRPWYKKFKLSLQNCRSFEDIERLLDHVDSWRGKKKAKEHEDSDLESDMMDGVGELLS